MRVSSITCVPTHKKFNLNNEKISANSNHYAMHNLSKCDSVSFGNCKLTGGIIGALVGEIGSVALFGPLGVLGIAGMSILGGIVGGAGGSAIGEACDEDAEEDNNKVQ